MPVILLLCAVGSYATGNNLFSVGLVGAFGILGFVMERNGYPVAALVLGIVMGSMVENNFVTSLIKSDGDVLPFFERPVSSVLAAMTLGALLWPAGVWIWNRVGPPLVGQWRGGVAISATKRAAGTCGAQGGQRRP